MFQSYFFCNSFSTTNLDKEVLGKLVTKAKLSNFEATKLGRAMAIQLRQKFDQPGREGATMQWCSKLVCMYPHIAGEGETMGKKTVSKHSINLFKIINSNTFETKSGII